jgi:hypothetical protein
VYFILLAWRWTSEVETCCEIKDITFTSCYESTLFPSLLYLTQRDDKRTNRGTHWAWSGCRAGVGVQLLRTPCTPLRWLHPPASCVSMHESVCNRTEAGCEVDLLRGDCEVHVPRETSTCYAGVSWAKIRFAGVRAWWPLHTGKLATARGTHRMRVARCSVSLQRYQLASWCLRTSCVHHSTSWDASNHPASHKSLGHLHYVHTTQVSITVYNPPPGNFPGPNKSSSDVPHYLESISILSSHLRLVLPPGLFAVFCK